MKKFLRQHFLLLAFMLCATLIVHVSFAQAPIIIPISGSSSVPVSSVRTYSIVGSGCYNWFVNNGTIQGSSTGTSVQVLWSSTPGSGSISVGKFPNCTPNQAPTHWGSLSVNITSTANPPTPCSTYTTGTCQWLQCLVTYYYNATSGSSKCAAVMGTYNGILQGYPHLSSCGTYLHGCN